MTAPRGGNALIIEKEQLAISNWQLAKGRYLVPGIWYWRGVATLCMLGFCDWDWVWVTQGSPMRDAREIQGSISRSSFVCNKDGKKGPVGGRSGDSMKGEVKRNVSPTTGGGGFTRHPAPNTLLFRRRGFSAVSRTRLIWVAKTSLVLVTCASRSAVVNHDSIGDFWASQAYSFVGLSEGA